MGNLASKSVMIVKNTKLHYNNLCFPGFQANGSHRFEQILETAWNQFVNSLQNINIRNEFMPDRAVANCSFVICLKIVLKRP